MTSSPAVTVAPAVPARARRGRRRRERLRTFSRRDVVVLSVMLGIPTLLLLALVWGPALASIGLSTTSWNGIGSLHGSDVVGVENYRNIVSNYPSFGPALRHNVIWLAFFAFISTPIGLLLAVLIDRNLKGSRLYQTAIFMPVVLSLALIGFIWQLIYSQDQGLINGLLGRTAPGQGIDFLGTSGLNLGAIMVAASWRHVGYVMILYLAGLKSLDPALREAAALDGAGEVATFRLVVFPALRPINIVVLVITVIESLRAFDIVYIVNKGTNGLELLSVLVTRNILGEASRIGFGSALAVILLSISLVPITAFLVQTFRGEQR